MKDSHEFTGSPGGWSIATFPDLLMRARRFMDPSGELLTVLVVLAACGGDPVTVTTNAEKAEPKPALVGTVIASGAFDITPVPVPTIGDQIVS